MVPSIFNIPRIEDNRAASVAKEDEDYEAEKQDQINMNKSLEDIREYEAQQVSC